MGMQNMVKLGSSTVTGGKIDPIDIGRDSFYSYMELRLVAGQGYQFTGTPVSRADGILQSLIPAFQIIANGKRVIKNCQPWMLKMQNYVRNGVLERRGSSAGAALLTYDPTVTSNFTFGVTTNITTVVDSVGIHFAMPFTQNPDEQRATLLNANGLTSLKMEFQSNSLSALNSQANTASITFENNSLQVELWGVKDVSYASSDRPQLYDYQQTTNSLSFTAGAIKNQLLQLQNSTIGLWFYGLDGAAGSATTATDRLASDKQWKNLRLSRNGQFDDFNISWAAAQDAMIAKYEVNNPYVNNVRIIDGINNLSYMDNSIFDALDTTNPGKVSSLYLYVESNPAPTGVYTNTSIMNFMQDALVKVPMSDNAN